MGIKTTFGSIAMNAHVPIEDATVVKNIKEKGAIIIAKSTMPGMLGQIYSVRVLV